MCLVPTVTALILTVLATRAMPVRSTDAFPLVAQAISARKALCFAARQDIRISPATVDGHSLSRAEVRIVADELQGGRRMRMTYRLPAPASGRVVVDDGLLMRQWERSRRLILQESSHQEPAVIQRRMLALLHQNYRCTLLASAVLAGLRCDVVRIRPRPGHAGPSRRLWIERTRHAILRTEAYDASGTRRYLSYFETFRYIRPPARGLFSLPTGVPVCRLRQSLRDRPDFQAAFAAAGLPGRLPAWLPPGYALISCAACSSPGAKRSVLLRYGDGLEMLSVLETPLGTGGSLVLPVRPDRQTWTRDIPPLHVAVIGDDTLPGGLGQNLLLALEPRTEAALRRGIAAQFGASTATMAARLRRRGWGYDRIIAFCLSRQSRARPTHLERRARGWIAATLAPRLGPPIGSRSDRSH